MDSSSASVIFSSGAKRERSAVSVMKREHCKRSLSVNGTYIKWATTITHIVLSGLLPLYKSSEQYWSVHTCGGLFTAATALDAPASSNSPYFTMHERERNQTTDTSTLSNNRQQRQQLTSWEIQNGIHRTRCMRGREIKQQTHQHWVTTVNNDNNLPAGWFKMAFTEHDAWEGEKSNNRHINTE